MSDRKIIRRYDEPAGGWGALKALGEHLVEQGVAVKGPITLTRMNQPDGFDCPGCAWPDPKLLRLRTMVGIGILLLAAAVTGGAPLAGAAVRHALVPDAGHGGHASGVSGRPRRLDDHRGGAPAMGHLRPAPNGRRCRPRNRRGRLAHSRHIRSSV